MVAVRLCGLYVVRGAWWCGVCLVVWCGSGGVVCVFGFCVWLMCVVAAFSRDFFGEMFENVENVFFLKNQKH